MITGARQGRLSGLRRLVASAMARDLGVFVVPGPEIARAHGLDIEAAGMQLVVNPRHASVLLVIGAISPSLCEATAVIYAQMVRPRALFILGSEELSHLPTADVVAGLSQSELVKGVQQLRRAFAEGAFRVEVSDFNAPILEIRIEYTCSMHPEVAQDEPGSCPKCGMDLIPREVQASSGHVHITKETSDTVEMQATSHADHHCHHGSPVEYTCPMHPEVIQNEPGSCPKCGMDLELRQTELTHEHSQMEHGSSIEYTCPMHPEVVQSEPGSCPKCGMDLEPREVAVEYTCPMHPEVVQGEPGSCPKCGMDLELRQTELTHEHSQMEHGSSIEYICPMHPEVVQSEPGSCPKCGMDLEPRQAESTHEHSQMEHGSSIEYTCPMHPEVIQSEPGSCPKCGMNLEPSEKTIEYTCPMHPEVIQNEPGSCPKCGMNLEPREANIEYTCPMHPEVVQSEPGSCPKCGMFLEPREAQGSHHEYADMNHDDSGFMSMIDVTKDLPRSGDDLAMDWIDVPFGPFFPGLPGGLLLTLTLDGDTVAGSNADTLVGNEPLLHHSMDSHDFIKRLAALEPLAPICYQVLGCLAIENATNIAVNQETSKIRIVVMERERIVNHLGWLVLFAQQTGFNWLLHRATVLQLELLHANVKQIMASKTAVLDLIKRLQHTPLLKSRTKSIGKLDANTDISLLGPVARASGINNDARSSNKTYSELGFIPASGKDGDVRARLQLRLDEISHSFILIERTSTAIHSVPKSIHVPEINNSMAVKGEAVIETPRGIARLQLTLDKGQVVAAQLDTPSTHHLALIEQLTSQQELGDALVAVGSLDLSPWEIQQ